MDTVPRNFKTYIDRADMLGRIRGLSFDGERFTPREPYPDRRTEAWNLNTIGRRGWTVVKRIDDFPPFNAIIQVQATMATAGKDGGWQTVTGSKYYLAELQGEAAIPDSGGDGTPPVEPNR